MTFSKKIYPLNSESVAEIFCDLCDISFPQLFVLTSAKYFQLKALKAMEILSGEQTKGPKKM